jgi:hypothetical protein
MHTLKNTLLFALTFLVISCTNDQPQESPPQLETGKLQGRWELTSATRNNRPTETLTGTYYLFNEDQVTTNLTPDGQERTFHFVSEGKTIHLKDESEFMAFQIDSLSDSLLWMRTEIRGHKFSLALKKQLADSTSVSAMDSISHQ